MNYTTITSLRNNLYKSLDQVMSTGIPVEVNRKGKRLQIVLADKVDKFANLKPHQSIIGDPDELIKLQPAQWQPNHLD